MKTHRSALLLALTLAAFGATGCGPRAGTESAESTAVRAEPTNAALIERASARMNLIASGDWISAYDYTAQDARKVLKLQDFLAKKDSHRYEKPKVEEVLRNDGTIGFVRLTMLWTPTDRRLKDVELEPGQSLTQEIEMYQTWSWSGSEWMYVRGQGPREFFEEHRELLRKGAGAPEQPSVSSNGAASDAAAPK
jgi:hypothetical protein